MVLDLKFSLKSKKAPANPQELLAGHVSATQLRNYTLIQYKLQVILLEISIFFQNSYYNDKNEEKI